MTHTTFHDCQSMASSTRILSHVSAEFRPILWRRLLRATSLLAVAIVTTTVTGAQATAQAPKSRDSGYSGKLFRREYHKADLSFCNSQICVDFDGDGRRELLFASRNTKQLQMLNAADGSIVWSSRLDGDSQSMSSYDLDGDGDFEILYSVSAPGRLYVLDHTGKVLRQWDSEDQKLGNSAVIADVDGDGQLDGLFGTRSKYLLRLNMADLTLARRRDGWVQCGCQTTAMDVDRDGRWDFFAGSGDDSRGKGVLHRYDPVTLNSVWSYKTNDNASSADPVLADIDGDGYVEVVKSVDNYGGDDAHDAIYAFETDGTLLWKTPAFSGEDSPNVADLDGDGQVELVGMTFGGEVYCLDSKGRIKWRKDLRPELTDTDAHAYLTPIICDVNGDRKLEILALTNGGFFDAAGKPAKKRKAATGIVFALSAAGEILDRFDVGGPRYWGGALVCNVDDDPFLELVVSGSGGLDVIETRGFGANTEHFQRRRNYQRLNVVPWAYEDSYFIQRGEKAGVVNLTDNLVLLKQEGRYRSSGTFTTELLTLPPGTQFDRVTFHARTPKGTTLRVNILDASGKTIRQNVETGAELGLAQPVRLRFQLATTTPAETPVLDAYHLSFRRVSNEKELTPEVAPRESVALAQDAPQPYRKFHKTDQIVLDVGRPGKFDSTQAKYPCVLKVGEQWWMWYNGRTDDRFTGSIGLATSKDGLRWTKRNNGDPVFEHGPPGSFDATKVDHPAVLHFEGKFHMWYTAGDKRSRYTIGYATSPDGVRWTRENDASPVLKPGQRGQFDDQVVLHPAVIRDDSGVLHIWYNGVGPQQSFRVGHATSRDGIHWTRQNDGKPVLEPSTVGEFREGYVYNVFVRPDNGRFDMWYSAWASNDRRSGPNHSGITHAVSSNGDAWRKDLVPTLTNGAAESIDEYACFACSIVHRGDELWMYYSAGSGESGGPYRVALAICRLSDVPSGR